MTQQIINIGAAPNDGQGDNLRTAFDKVNDNFSNVWAQGPVDSNVRIQGNTISTLQVNQDLALSPNGTGNIRLNNNTIPGANNTWFLGSTTNRWRGLYVGNVTANNLSVSGIVDLSGDVTVGGNLTVVGNTIQIGNITTDTKTIQLANTATTDGAANGAGVTVGANDDIATLLYESGNNVWTTNIGLQVGGPVTGTSLAVSSATVYGNIAAINGNFTGNVTANYFFGNGSQLTGIQTGATISNTAPALGNGGIWWNSVDGRAYVKYANAFIDMSPSLVPDPTTYVGNVSFDDITVTNVGNIIPAGNNAYSLGSAAFQWKDLWVSNNTIYINSVPITLGAGNVLTVDGNAVLQNDSNTNITTTGTITAGNIITNNISSDDSSFVTIVDGLNVDGEVEAQGNITASYFIGDGSQLTNLPSAGGGIVFEYAISNFTANALPLPGTMQFTSRGGEVVSPELGSKLWINANDDTGLNTGSTWLAMAQNSERGTVTLQRSSDQLPYRVSNIGVYNTPELYRGYRAGVNQIWGDDPSINQIIISNATSPVFYNENFDIENDVFHATGLADATAVYMVNVYGSNQYAPLSQTDLWSFFTSFVDNVIYQGTNTETLDVAEIRTAFYTNFNNFYNSVSTTAYDRNFRFATGSTYYSDIPTNTSGGGTGARLRVRLNTDYTYTVMGISAPGSEYEAADTITVPGNLLNGATPANDLVVTVDTVDGNGGITAVTLVSGVAAYPWRSNSISDGGDDQYDTGNRINTNLATSIIYAGGNVTAGTTQFGTDSEYAVMYNNSIFCMAATDVDITDLYYSGNLGSDGEGFLRWSGLRSPNSAIAVEYAYMDCEPGTGNLEVSVGPTYQVALDSGGINFNGFYSYLNDANGDWYFGTDRDWKLESRAQLAVQSYSTLELRTLIPLEAASMGSPAININTSNGSDGNGQFNQQAGSGGSISIRAGDAGTNDNVPTLGSNGGGIEIIAGDATGNGQVGGAVLIQAGGGDGGTGGNLTLQTSPGVTANGVINLTTDDGGTLHTWTLDATGNINLPPNGDLNFAAGGIWQTPDEDLRIRVQDADDDGWAVLQEVDDGAGNVLGLTQLRRDAFIVEFAGGANPQFRLNENGQMQLPGNVRWDNHQDQSLYVIADNNGDGTIELKTISYANDTLGSNIRVSQSNATISTGNAAHTWNFDNTGNLTVPGQPAVVKTTNTGFEFSGSIVGITYDTPVVITIAESVFGDPEQGQVTISGVNPPVQANGTWYYQAVEANQFALYSDAALTQPVDPTDWPGYVDGGTAVCLGQHDMTLLAGNVTINSNLNNNTFNWTFDNTGNLTLPQGGVVYETGIPGGALTGNTIALKPQGGTNADQQLLIYPTAGPVTDNNHLHLTTGNLYNTELFLGNDDLYVKLANTGDIVINSNDGIGNTAQWIFGTDGVLTLPGEGILQSINDTVALLSLNTSTGNANSVYLGSSGGLGFNDQEAGGNWLEIFRSGAEPEIRVPVGRGNLNIQTAEGINAYNWTFDNTGNLTVPGHIIVAGGIVGTGASPAPTLSGFSSVSAITVSATGNVTGGNLNVGSGTITGGNVNGATFNGNVAFGSGTVGGSGNIDGGNISTSGRLSATGNIVTGGQIQSSAFTGGNIFWAANNRVDFQGAIKVGGTGQILSPGGAASITLNNNGANIPILGVTNTSNSTSTTTGALIVSGGAGVAGNLYVGGNIVGNTAGFAIGYRDIPQVAFTGNATIATTDAGKHFYSTQSSNFTLTIANNASQSFQVGAAITVVNQGTGTISIAQGSGVTLYLAGNATSGNRSVATFGMATIMKVATDTWFINGTGVS